MKEDNSLDKNVKQSKKKVASQTKKENMWVWPIKIFFLAVALSLLFSITSEIIMSGAGIVLALLCIIIFISISVITDMIGVAVTACSKEPFIAMASRKVRGAKEALFLIKNADRVASLSADVIGEVCGILSGAAGATVLAYIVANSTSQAFEIVMASVVSAIIAGLTIFGKAIIKRYAINNCNKIVLALGKILSVFTKKPKAKDKQKKEENKDNVTIESK